MRKNGFTLVEVLVAVGIVGFIMMGFTQFNSLSLAVAGKGFKKSSLQGEAFQLTLALENPLTCSKIFAGLTLSKSEVQYSGNFSYALADGEIIYPAFKDVSQLKEVRILQNPLQPTYAELQITLLDEQSPAITLPLFLETDDDHIIQNCSTRPLFKDNTGGCQ